jgi:hypothetical protein
MSVCLSVCMYVCGIAPTKRGLAFGLYGLLTTAFVLTHLSLKFIWYDAEVKIPACYKVIFRSCSTFIRFCFLFAACVENLFGWNLSGTCLEPVCFDVSMFRELSWIHQADDCSVYCYPFASWVFCSTMMECADNIATYLRLWATSQTEGLRKTRDDMRRYGLDPMIKSAWRT